MCINKWWANGMAGLPASASRVYVVVQWGGYAGDRGPIAIVFCNGNQALSKALLDYCTCQDEDCDLLDTLQGIMDDGYLEVLACPWEDQMVAGNDIGQWSPMQSDEVIKLLQELNDSGHGDGN